MKALGATNSSVVTVEFTAVLNENANIGSLGNPNEVYLEYSNNPNKSEAGDNTPGTPDQPDQPDQPEDEHETGKTPNDVVIVFTYKVVVNKVDNEGNDLPGAGFTLYKKDAESGEYVELAAVEAGTATQFSFVGLDDGEYKLVETDTPQGYNSIEDIEFTVTAEHDILSDNPALTSLSGEAVSGEVTFTPVVSQGSLSTDVVNNKGTTLPETGGMGTSIFYILGSILAVAAVVLLVKKKRMGAEQ